MLLKAPAEPWLSFLNDLDAQLEEVTDLHCIGGFAIVQAYGLERATADIDVLSVTPYHSGSRLVELAGKESALRLKHRIYLDVVTVATAPEDYASRLAPPYAGVWGASGCLPFLEAHDLVQRFTKTYTIGFAHTALSQAGGCSEKH